MTSDPDDVLWRLQRYRDLKSQGRTGAANEVAEGILRDYKPRLERLLAPFRHSGRDLDELRAAGEQAVFQAIDRFDPGRGVQFRTFADAWVRGEIRKALRPSGPVAAQVESFENIAAVTPECDPEIAGDLFGRAVLLAVLPLPDRLACLEWMLTGSWPTPGDAAAALRHWDRLVWPRWILNRDAHLPKVIARLRLALEKGRRLTQENAAWAVWVLHAYPAAGRRFDSQVLAALAQDVIRAASGGTDRALKWIAIHLAESLDASALVRSLAESGFVYHVVNSPILQRAAGVHDLLVEQLASAAGWIVGSGQSRGGTENLFVAWDLPRTLASQGCHAGQVLRGSTPPQLAAYATAAAAAQGGRDEAMEGFRLALGQDRRFRHSRLTPETLPLRIEDCLEGTGEARRLSTLRRRTAAEMLRFIDDPGLRYRLIEKTLAGDRSPFVRLTALTLAGNSRDPAYFPMLRDQVRGNSNSRSVQAVGVALEAAVRVSPTDGIELCTQAAGASNTELRGRALCMLGELRRRRLGDERDALVRELCARTRPERESALNMAQILLARRGLERPWVPGEFGLQLPFRPPVWFSHWVQDSGRTEPPR